MKGYSFRSLTDLVLKIFKTKVIAGTGLSGGGSLEADRTLTVKYGTAAGTAAQGNDNRLSNSREWTAATVSEAEAEAGTATTRRAFTAQRVRQAINAWWQLVTSGFGRNFIAASNEQAARDVLQLGTAATANLGTDSRDAARGDHTHSQYWDIRSRTGYAPSGSLDSFKAGQGGYVRLPTNENAPRTGLDVITKAQYDNTDLLQIALPQRTAEEMYMRTAQGGTWRNWLRFWHSGNFDPATKANTSTQVIAGTGLTGGGNLSANRTLNVTYGTTAGTAVQGNDSRVVNAASNASVNAKEAALETKKADKSITITAGTGLTGGGTLAANRSLSVKYGTAAGTAVQGNDSRVVNALQKGNNLNDIANTTSARSNLGLGSAATKDVGTTAGQVMEVGAFGVGGEPENLVNSTTDAAPVGSITRFNTISSVSIDKGLPDVGVEPSAIQWWNLFTFGSPTRRTQITSEVFGAGGGGNYKGRIFTRVKHDANWTDWVELFTTGNLLQTTGTSTTFPMSQKAVTDALNTKAPSSHTHPWSQVTGQPATATRWPTFTEVTGKPANYPTTWNSVAAKPAQATRWPTFTEVTDKPANYPTTWNSVAAKPAQATRWPTFTEVTDKPANYPTTWNSVAAKPAQATRWPSTAEVAGLTAALAAKADTSTQVIAGTGLTGGGNLSSNRTLSLAASHTPIGVGQTWQNVTALRRRDTSYTNTTGRTIVVMLMTGNNNKNFYINGESFDLWQETGTATFIIPPGTSYSTDNNFHIFMELR